MGFLKLNNYSEVQNVKNVFQRGVIHLFSNWIQHFHIAIFKKLSMLRLHES